MEDVVLTGRHVRLEPLQLGHVPALCDVGLDSTLWQWTTTRLSTTADMRDYVEAALALRREGTALPFVIRHLRSDRLVGSTRFGNYDAANKRVEVGWTWVAPPWQRSAVNTEAKYLLLQHAFDTLGCIRVELKTDLLNEVSQRAIERIGGVREGVLRKHMIVAGGRVRDTVYYSIVDAEWPHVQARLRELLERGETPRPSSRGEHGPLPHTF